LIGDMDRSKALVTRGALERVLARAAELQSASGEEGEQRDTLTEAQVEELGREVGLSAQHIRQALAEERARIEPMEMPGTGIAFQLFGADRVGAQRVVRGKAERILATLDRWMQKEEWLQVVRQRADRILWEPRRGLLGSLRRVLGSRDYVLSRADEIAATVVSVDEDSTLVRLEANFSSLRRAMAGQTAAGAVIGGAGTGVAIVLNAMIPIAIIPAIGLSAVAYYSSRRTQQRAVQRGSLVLEQVLDRLERGDASAPSLLRLIESALPPNR
jgi:hypothetical protein